MNRKKNIRKELAILCWNIGNPSEKRASLQLDWLLARPEDVLVLTETKNSRGCNLIETRLRGNGFFCMSSSPVDDYGVLIASRFRLQLGTLEGRMSYLPSRAVSVILKLKDGQQIEIVGMYVPSRDASEQKVARKKQYLAEAAQVVQRHFSPVRRVICGDLNILEPSHVPRYPFFKSWEYNFYNHVLNCGFVDTFRYRTPEANEYSWVGRTGDGYRYDHCFVSSDLQSHIAECEYVHEPRRNRLSDHSAIVLLLDLGRDR